MPLETKIGAQTDVKTKVALSVGMVVAVLVGAFFATTLVKGVNGLVLSSASTTVNLSASDSEGKSIIANGGSLSAGQIVVKSVVNNANLPITYSWQLMQNGIASSTVIHGNLRSYSDSLNINLTPGSYTAIVNIKFGILNWKVPQKSISFNIIKRSCSSTYLAGDVNKSGSVDAADLQITVNAQLNQYGLERYPCLDINNDSKLDDDDYYFLQLSAQGYNYGNWPFLTPFKLIVSNGIFRYWDNINNIKANANDGFDMESSTIGVARYLAPQLPNSYIFPDNVMFRLGNAAVNSAGVEIFSKINNSNVLLQDYLNYSKPDLWNDCIIYKGKPMLFYKRDIAVASRTIFDYNFIWLTTKQNNMPTYAMLNGTVDSSTSTVSNLPSIITNAMDKYIMVYPDILTAPMTSCKVIK